MMIVKHSRLERQINIQSLFLFVDECSQEETTINQSNHYNNNNVSEWNRSS